MTFEERIHEALARFLRTKGIDCTQVVSFEDDNEIERFYGCETCGGADTIEYYVIIRYIPAAETKSREYQYKGPFTELIRELTD